MRTVFVILKSLGMYFLTMVVFVVLPIISNIGFAFLAHKWSKTKWDSQASGWWILAGLSGGVMFAFWFCYFNSRPQSSPQGSVALQQA